MIFDSSGAFYQNLCAESQFGSTGVFFPAQAVIGSASCVCRRGGFEIVFVFALPGKADIAISLVAIGS